MILIIGSFVLTIWFNKKTSIENNIYVTYNIYNKSIKRFAEIFAIRIHLTFFAKCYFIKAIWTLNCQKKL